MGVIADDLDGNGSYDLFLTHLMNEANTLYGNLGGAAGFKDMSGFQRPRALEHAVHRLRCRRARRRIGR